MRGLGCITVHYVLLRLNVQPIVQSEMLSYWILAIKLFLQGLLDVTTYIRSTSLSKAQTPVIAW